MGAPAQPPGVTGLVVVDKEAGWTSHDVVARCRRLFGQRRVGHAGTLDPDATGVLLVGLGRFTRMLRFVQGLGKSYVGEVVLGTSTSTLDSSGEVTGTWDMSEVTLDDARAAAAALTGRIKQVPPMVSALKVGGERLHNLARQGIEVEREPRWVTVDRFDVSGTEGKPGVLRIEVDCSTGTYVRTLADDLGTALGGGAHLRNLRRVRVGSFTDSEAHRLDEIAPEHVLTAAQGLRDMTRIQVGTETARRVSHGLSVERSMLATPSSGPVTGDGPFALVDRSGRLLAVYESRGPERIVAACVLAS
jgi:tRNA pseudouridine55 synthase